jgi:hypothetical protein
MTSAMMTKNVGISVAAAPSLATSFLLHLRGGASAALNLSRESYCITELAAYGTLTALVMNSALRLWTSTKFSKRQHPFVCNSFTISTATCVISGVFTAILFQLLGIYSKSALGMSNDEGYAAFKAATAIYRKWGFRMFLTELVSFVYTFMISLYNTLWIEWDESTQQETENPVVQRRVGTCIFGVSLLFILLGGFHLQKVLSLATNLIFTASYSDKFA